jgi:hypothetical protein
MPLVIDQEKVDDLIASYVTDLGFRQWAHLRSFHKERKGWETPYVGLASLDAPWLLGISVESPDAMSGKESSFDFPRINLRGWRREILPYRTFCGSMTVMIAP